MMGEEQFPAYDRTEPVCFCVRALPIFIFCHCGVLLIWEYNATKSDYYKNLWREMFGKCPYRPPEKYTKLTELKSKRFAFRSNKTNVNRKQHKWVNIEMQTIF